MTIRQAVTFNSSPEKIYEILMTSDAFAKMTGAPAEIEDSEGGKFSCFGGQITGRHLVLQKNAKIIQAWRAGPWGEGAYSIVRFDIARDGDNSTLNLTHTGYPDGESEHLESGWHKMYWEPLHAFLG